MGGAYLIFLGIGLLRNTQDRQGTATGVAQAGSVAGAWFRGLAVNLANPESAVLVASIYAVSLPPEPGLALGAAVIAVIALISLGWYSVLVLCPTSALAGQIGRLEEGKISTIRSFSSVVHRRRRAVPGITSIRG